jgi:hypothetical protein
MGRFKEFFLFFELKIFKLLQNKPFLEVKLHTKFNENAF